MSDEIVDLEGNVVQQGDRVAGAFRIGNTAVLRTGTVQGFGERANRLTVKVIWDHDSNYPGPGPLSDAWRIKGAIEAELYRFVRIGS